MLFERSSISLVPWLSYSGFVSFACYQWFIPWWIMLNDLYYYTSYLRNRGDIIKVRSIIRIQVFFFHLRAKGCAEGATKGAIGFQEAALIPAEEENSDEEEQDWDWDKDPVDPFVRFFICGVKISSVKESLLWSTLFCSWLKLAFWTRFSCLLIRRCYCLSCS